MRIIRAGVIVALALGLFAWPPSSGARQPRKVPLVGILSDEAPPLAAKSLEPLVQRLCDLGYVEGQNITFERRYAAEKFETLPSLALELIRLQPDVILAIGTAAALAAKAATQTIPIVFARVGDPVGAGLVAGLARPGGNLTGLSIEFFDIDGKRLELLVTAVPGVKRVGALWDPNFPTAGPELKGYESAARSLKIDLIAAEARAPDDFEPALHAVVQRHAGALVVIPAITFTEHLHQLLDLPVEARLPSMFYRREFVDAGGLMSYGPDIGEMYRRAAVYLDKILKGAKPADIPVEQPTKFQLVINLKTAKALGLTIPLMLLARADDVIE